MSVEITNTQEVKKEEKQEIPQAEQKDPNKRTKIFMGLLITLIVLFVAVILIRGAYKGPQQETLEYNYFNFTEEGGLWKTTIQRGNQPYEILLRFNPEQVEDVAFKGGVTRDFFNGPIYITFDPTSDGEQMKYLALGGAELSLNVVRALGIEVIAACTKNETEACIDRPIMNCGDNASVIEMRTGPTEVQMNNTCVVVQGEGFGVLRSIDRILYHWYGIINPLDAEFDELFNQTIDFFRNQS